VLDEGKFGPKVDQIYGLHMIPDLNVGYVAVKSGPIMAASDLFTITVKGRGGHGARPQGTKDCIVAACQLVLSLHTIVSRNINPLDSAVLTVGVINGGYGYNIIADKVVLGGTVRTLFPTTQELIIQRMQSLCQGLSQGFDLECSLDYQKSYPCTVNKSEEHVEKVRAAVRQVAGSQRIILPETAMASEDMSFFLNRVPGCYFFLGCSPVELKAPVALDPQSTSGGTSIIQKESSVGQLHTCNFDLNERVLPVGVSVFVHLIRQLLA